MAQAKITLIGIENYLNPERSVFDNMVLPDGIDRNTLIGSILLRCQEFELLYSDPDFLTDAVNIWSRKNYWTFDKWVKAINTKYDPLYNYDRTEEWTDTHEGDYSKKGNGSSSGSTNDSSDYTRTDNLTHASDHTRTDNLTMTNNLSDTNDVTVTHSEKAFNDTNLVTNQQNVTDQDQSHTGTVTNTGTQRNAGTDTDSGTVRDAGSASGSYSNTNNTGESGDDSFENTHKGRMYGNIGVTTSQQMLQSELDIARWNMYEHIADLFASEFCIMVY